MSARSLPPAVPATALRVYEPAHSFPAVQRARWGVEQGCADIADRAERAAQAERSESWRRLVRGRRGRYPLTRAGAEGAGRGGMAEDDEVDPLADHVRILRIDGALLLCPATLGDREGPRRSLVRAWDLPLPWMLVVALSAVPVAGDAPPAGNGRTDGAVPGVAGTDGAAPGVAGTDGAGRYLAPMSRARAQAARVLRTLRAAMPGTELVAEVELVARWLEGFHPRSWLELDGRSVVALLAGDDGLEDVRLGMVCLASGDRVGADVAYQRLRRRSRALTDISRLS